MMVLHTLTMVNDQFITQKHPQLVDGFPYIMWKELEPPLEFNEEVYHDTIEHLASSSTCVNHTMIGWCHAHNISPSMLCITLWFCTIIRSKDLWTRGPVQIFSKVWCVEILAFEFIFYLHPRKLLSKRDTLNPCVG